MALVVVSRAFAIPHHKLSGNGDRYSNPEVTALMQKLSAQKPGSDGNEVGLSEVEKDEIIRQAILTQVSVIARIFAQADVVNLQRSGATDWALNIVRLFRQGEKGSESRRKREAELDIMAEVVASWKALQGRLEQEGSERARRNMLVQWGSETEGQIQTLIRENRLFNAILWQGLKAQLLDAPSGNTDVAEEMIAQARRDLEREGGAPYAVADEDDGPMVKAAYALDHYLRVWAEKTFKALLAPQVKGLGPAPDVSSATSCPLEIATFFQAPDVVKKVDGVFAEGTSLLDWSQKR
ncbi:MAG: hypothetical protein R3B54_07275 [Bdellovibrionota bacterium]